MISHIHHETSSADPVGLDLFQMKSVSLKWTSLRTAEDSPETLRTAEDSPETLRTDTEDSSDTLRTAQRHWGQLRDTEDSSETLRTAQRHWGQLRYTEDSPETLRTAQRHWGQPRDTEDSSETLRTAQRHWGKLRDTEDTTTSLCLTHSSQHGCILSVSIKSFSRTRQKFSVQHRRRRVQGEVVMWQRKGTLHTLTRRVSLIPMSPSNRDRWHHTLGSGRQLMSEVRNLQLVNLRVWPQCYKDMLEKSVCVCVCLCVSVCVCVCHCCH